MQKYQHFYRNQKFKNDLCVLFCVFFCFVIEESKCFIVEMYMNAFSGIRVYQFFVRVRPRSLKIEKFINFFKGPTRVDTENRSVTILFMKTKDSEIKLTMVSSSKFCSV